MSGAPGPEAEKAPAAGAALDAGPPAGRRALTYVVLVGLVGAGLTLYASTRLWSVEMVARPAPLPEVRVEQTGAELHPWLPALAVVALAGMGAVLASRGVARRLVGLLLLLIGLSLLGGGLAAVGTPSAGAGPGWPVLAALGGLLVAGAAVAILGRGHRWPAMGARYERPGRSVGHRQPGGDPMAAGQMGGSRTTSAWDALDRGEDPTVS